MDSDSEILKRLHAIPEKEWVDVVDKLTVYVHFKLKGRTIFGAHSEQYLGIDPINYYIGEAIGKLFSLEWQWQFEKYSLLDQLKKIVWSLMSTNVDKYKVSQKTKKAFEEIRKPELEVDDEDHDDENYKLFRNALDECSKDDEDLQLYVMALDECRSFDEMVKALGFDKKKLYALQKKMTRRVTSYIETKKNW
ncbi:hypothetical protein [Prolixibacter sp. SD074]|jgi:hypothetical protein|uniref:hypothetical protein n=1 Tax=Prolixibacter sp. SD074 TaxID=2652391 RepID=UPI0012843B04|nr:hypothetical protein [Prolixibacter sp. SD074]GET30794.1 hypothetical protein SD074_29960 [Prolixibacter sp. SD074]